ncbi:conserved hypothetical protein [Nitrospina gracilis 3/211]|uniref:PRTase-CE domain-containing protein n=1 Tax=Nitrospina gracilis (strain 3/211) TaxID=1266370 RepID=M1YYE1_NITG3|nr:MULTISPECIES: hypothetical protein [Nitrospina]MCF8723610.1 hypothetical protein [Nitrospina sp. Nb-3]CCQ90693.1 conserved hypothetical protein [Nitrospina gracilis 3/211]
MTSPLSQKIQHWVNSGQDLDCLAVYDTINFLDQYLYFSYEPTRGPSPEFNLRLENWLNNFVEDEDQKFAFKLIPNIFFIGRDEMETLYRSSYNGPIARWLIDQIGLNFSSRNPEKQLKHAVRNTYFFPVTDSLRINSFFHLNNIPGGQDFRPDLRSLMRFGDSNKIKKEFQGISRLILLEDFVGSGEQSFKDINDLASLLPNTQILFVPLIICPKGLENMNFSIAAHSNLSIAPTLEINKDNLISTDNSQNSLYFLEVKKLIMKYYKRMTGGCLPGPKPYHYLGYQKTGSLLILFTNSPDNSLPIIHWTSDSWESLFPRHSRI